ERSPGARQDHRGGEVTRSVVPEAGVERQRGVAEETRSRQVGSGPPAPALFSDQRWSMVATRRERAVHRRRPTRKAGWGELLSRGHDEGRVQHVAAIAS